MELIAFLILACLLTAVLQVLVLEKGRKRWLRWLLLALPAGCAAYAVLIYEPNSMFGGLSALASLYFLMLGICALLGWGLAWGVWALRNRKKHCKIR